MSLPRISKPRRPAWPVSSPRPKRSKTRSRVHSSPFLLSVDNAHRAVLGLDKRIQTGLRDGEYDGTVEEAVDSAAKEIGVRNESVQLSHTFTATVY